MFGDAIIGLFVGQSNNDINRFDGTQVTADGVTFDDARVRIWNPHIGAFQTLAEAKAANDPTWPGSTPRAFFTASMSAALATRLAEAEDKKIYVICPNWPGSPIANWLPETAMQYASDKAMVEAALASIGATKVDFVTMLQGESDYTRTSAAYRADHDAWRAQLRAETWCGPTTPFILVGLAWGGATAAQNDTLGRIAIETPYVGYANSLDLPTDELAQHYTPMGLWRLGYERAYAALADAKLGFEDAANGFQPIVTESGFLAAVDAKTAGFAVEIAEVAVGDAGYLVPVNAAGRATQEALIGERQRVSVQDVREVGDGQKDISFVLNGADEYLIKEVGFYLADGTLFAVTSHPTLALMWKTANTRAAIALELVFEAVEPGAVNIVSSGPPLTLLVTHELAVISNFCMRNALEGLRVADRLKQMTGDY